MYEIIREPYRINKNDTLKEFVERYEKDPANQITIDQLCFFRLLTASHFELADRPVSTHIVVSSNVFFPTGASLVDEDGHEFRVISREFTSCFAPAMAPYHIKTASYVLNGPAEKIGEYLAIVSAG